MYKVKVYNIPDCETVDKMQMSVSYSRTTVVTTVSPKDTHIRQVTYLLAHPGMVLRLCSPQTLHTNNANATDDTPYDDMDEPNHPFADAFQLFVIPKSKLDSWAYQLVYEFHEIETFWPLMHHYPPLFGYYHLCLAKPFRPELKTPHYQDYGTWSFIVCNTQCVDVFVEFMMALVGNTLLLPNFELYHAHLTLPPIAGLITYMHYKVTNFKLIVHRSVALHHLRPVSPYLKMETAIYKPLN